MVSPVIAIQYAWNSLTVALFNVPTLSFIEAYALSIIAALLFKTPDFSEVGAKSKDRGEASLARFYIKSWGIIVYYWIVMVFTFITTQFI